jgi:hypothetical protein
MELLAYLFIVPWIALRNLIKRNICASSNDNRGLMPTGTNLAWYLVKTFRVDCERQNDIMNWEGCETTRPYYSDIRQDSPSKPMKQLVSWTGTPEFESVAPSILTYRHTQTHQCFPCHKSCSRHPCSTNLTEQHRYVKVKRYARKNDCFRIMPRHTTV